MHILTFAIGDIPYKEPALRILQDYFKYKEVPFTVIEKDPDINIRKAHPSWLKLLAHQILPNEDFILCWDLDLLPVNKHDGVDITSYWSTQITMVQDSGITLGGTVPGVTIPYTSFKYNGGLIGIPKRHSVFMEYVYYKHAPGTRDSFEQFYLNDEIVAHNITVEEFPDCFNSLYPHQGYDRTNFENAYHRHYTWGVAHEHKLKLIQEHATRYFSKT